MNICKDTAPYFIISGEGQGENLFALFDDIDHNLN